MAYDVRKVSVIVDGKYITGFSDDAKVSVEKAEDTQIEYIGVEGDVDFAKNSNESGTVKIKLKSTSPSVGYLNGLANARKQFAISVVDTNDNGVQANGTEAVVKKPMFPDRDKEIGEVEFEIFVGDLTIQ